MHWLKIKECKSILFAKVRRQSEPTQNMEDVVQYSKGRMIIGEYIEQTQKLNNAKAQNGQNCIKWSKMVKKGQKW